MVMKGQLLRELLINSYYKSIALDGLTFKGLKTY